MVRVLVAIAPIGSVIPAILVEVVEVERILLILLGLIVAAFTAKPAIFLILHRAKVPLPELSPTEQAVGQTIGQIERLLAYCFVLDEADNAIAMLIAAKGVYRLHELGIGKQPDRSEVGVNSANESERKTDEKTFYIMVGTFASSLMPSSLALWFGSC